MHRWVALSILLTISGACARNNPSVSAEEHQRMAEESENLAVEHEAQFDPNAAQVPCVKYCFSKWTNPTIAHLQEAERLRRLAEKHREARRRLRVAEARSCAGVPERDRDISPFFHLEDIVSIEFPAREHDPFVVEFAVANTSAAQFRELVDCHLARNASMGFDMPEMDYCPLAVPGVEVQVKQAGEHIRVELDSDEPTARAEIRERLVALEGTALGDASLVVAAEAQP